MKNYGFVIDNRSCIGCHACSTACKAENEVPLGVNRTWVKYVDKGQWPDARRHFQVTRCNHCANPPCVTICPVSAMYQRTDGIVDFDGEACIGCKACMQACPYDAIYIDPNSGTAAKCHYCAHRTDLSLEPACVVVCPTHAIIAGDLNDPRSEIAQLIARESVVARKPEQGTVPKLFYIEADAVTLNPPAGIDTSGQMFAEQRSEQAWDGPLHVGGNLAAHMVQTSYTAQHKIPWHWPVPAYLVTKAIGGGAGLILALLFGLGALPFSRPVALSGALLALCAIGVTTGLLVLDLDRPERFLRILMRPQWRSWLTRGAFILIGYTTVLALWLFLEWLAGPAGIFAAASAGTAAAFAALARPWLLTATAGLAVGTIVYTAFLFGQAEGRDLWQSTLLPGHLTVQAIMAGSAGLLLLLGGVVPAVEGLFGEMLWTMAVAQWLEIGGGGWLIALLIGAVIVDLGVTLLGELGMPHASVHAARAAHAIRAGRHKYTFWGGAVIVGHILPLILLAPVATGSLANGQVLSAIMAAAIAATVGLYAFEHAFVMAPQEIPNS